MLTFSGNGCRQMQDNWQLQKADMLHIAVKNKEENIVENKNVFYSDDDSIGFRTGYQT
jgi:hypothetical protein